MYKNYLQQKNIMINKNKFKFIESLSNSNSYSEPVLNDTIGIHKYLSFIQNQK